MATMANTTGEARAASKGAAVASACEVCGNTYDKAFQIIMGGQTHTFDSFECAISALAPACAHCKCRIVGHGVEESGTMYCCAHCARNSDVKGLQDRV
jgi:phage terminase large subunit GpA-like protein